MRREFEKILPNNNNINNQETAAAAGQATRGNRNYYNSFDNIYNKSTNNQKLPTTSLNRPISLSGPLGSGGGQVSQTTTTTNSAKISYQEELAKMEGPSISNAGGSRSGIGHPGESMKLTARNKSASSSKSSINSENLYTKNLTFTQLFKRSILKNGLLVSTIVAVFLAFTIGMIMRQTQGTTPYSREVVQLIGFPGDMFLRMLKMLILPLIIASVISALASLDSTVSGKIGMRACGFYMTTTVVATITGIILVTLLHPGDVKMKQGFQSGGAVVTRGKGSTLDAVTDLVRSIIPDNIVAACFQHSETHYSTEEVRSFDGKGGFVTRNETIRKIVNKEGANVLGLMFFCCIFGVICSKLGEKAVILVKFFEALDHTVMRMVLLAMYFSPIGIMSLIIEKLLIIEDMNETMGRLGMYMVTVIIGLILHGFISIPGMYMVVTRKNPLTFMRKCTECIVFAIGTGSSTATLPVTFKCLEENVKCDTRITRFVLPIGATINMDGTALYEAVAAIFIGQMNGMVFSFADLIIISLTSTAASFGAAAVPSAGLVTMIMVLTAVGLPTEDITMIVAVDWFLDRIRTAVNVLSDGYVAGIVAHLSKDELEKYDAEQGVHPELGPADSQDMRRLKPIRWPLVWTRFSK